MKTKKGQGNPLPQKGIKMDDLQDYLRGIKLAGEKKMLKAVMGIFNNLHKKDVLDGFYLDASNKDSFVHAIVIEAFFLPSKYLKERLLGPGWGLRRGTYFKFEADGLYVGGLDLVDSDAPEDYLGYVSAYSDGTKVGMNRMQKLLDMSRGWFDSTGGVAPMDGDFRGFLKDSIESGVLPKAVFNFAASIKMQLGVWACDSWQCYVYSKYVNYLLKKVDHE